MYAGNALSALCILELGMYEWEAPLPDTSTTPILHGASNSPFFQLGKLVKLRPSRTTMFFQRGKYNKRLYPETAAAPLLFLGHHHDE